MIGIIKKPAFTLIEVIVSVAIFAIIVLLSAQIFQSVVSSQIKNFSETALQDDVKYFLEVLTREARGALKNTTSSAICSGQIEAGKTYGSDGATLYFQNKLGNCVAYYSELDANGINRLVIDRDGDSFDISSDAIDIRSLKFVVAESDTIQPLVTLNVMVESKANPDLPALNVQTSINSGWYSN